MSFLKSPNFAFLGGEFRFLGDFWESFWEDFLLSKFGKDDYMIKKNYKGRCIKKSVEKSKEVCKIYNDIQLAYLNILQSKDDVTDIQCSVPLSGDTTEEYCTDFLCTKSNGDLMVRECVFRKLLTKPMTIKLLDMSKAYWLCHGVEDWGLVIDEEK